MKEKLIAIEGYLFQVIFHPVHSQLLGQCRQQEAAIAGIFQGPVTSQFARPVDYRLDVCQYNRQLFGISRNVMNRDGYRGIKIPSQVYRMMMKQFGGWLYPPADMLETARFTYIFRQPSMMGYREILAEISALNIDQRILEHVKKIQPDKVPVVHKVDGKVISSRHADYFIQRIGQLQAEVTRRGVKNN